MTAFSILDESQVLSLFEGFEAHLVSWSPVYRDILTPIDDVTGNEALLSNVEYQSNHAIREIFDTLSKGFFEVTPKWAERLQKYVYSFITRRVGLVDYMEFFGSPYLGLQKVTFTTADRNAWFVDIFDCDEEELRENLHACQAIKKEWAVVGDAFNMTVPYLLYRINKSTLPQGMKHQAMKDVLCMYHYKCLTSIIHNDYPFQARREVVIETYNRLSKKYDIKVYGSWKALIEARAEWILSPKTGIHYEAFTKMDDDKKIVYMVGDIQNRLRRAINDINKVFHDVKNKANIVRLEGSKVSMGDELTIKSVSKEINQYVMYMERILTEQSSFYKEELAQHVAAVLDDVRMDMFTYTLQEFPKRYNNPKMPEYKQFAETVLLHMFEYLHANNVKKSDVYKVLIKMRGAYGASRSKNDMVKIIRELGDQIVIDITGRKTPQWVLTTRTALSLFIVLRVLSKDFFS